MGPVNVFLDGCYRTVRGMMLVIAKFLNKVSRGKLSPAAVTITGLLTHLPIAWLIATGHSNVWSAILLVIFGLFDTLDGQLARLQGRASSAGMLLDATTDRMKEVLLYTGAAYAIISTGRPYLAVWAVAACGASLCVSYVKAKGEMAVRASNLSPNEINRLFSAGLLRFEVRMFILIIGLLSNRVSLAVIVIAVLASLTAFGRLVRITGKLADVQN